MGFDAATVVEPLDWDFTKFDAGQGIVPEPADRAIDQFFKDLTAAQKKIMEKAGLPWGKDVTPERLLVAIADLPEESTVGIADYMAELNKVFAKLCKQQPSAAQLAKLPLRIRLRFFVWLVRELRPEDFGAASMRAPVIPINRGTSRPA